MIASLADRILHSGKLRAVAGMLGSAALALTPPMAIAQEQAGPSIIRDTEIEAILRADTDPILRAAGLEPKNVKLHLVGDKELNAFVAGGQQMFLHTGLIIKTKNPNELKGVIAHETGHIAGGDLARQDNGAKSALAVYALTFGLGLLAAMAGEGETAANLLYNSGYFATLQMLGYTRQQEANADQAAAKYLDAAGESGRGLVDFFDNFRYQEVFSNARRDKFFQSHPISSQRIEALRAVVAAKPNYGKTDSDQAMEDHRVMVAKLRGFINYPQQTAVDYPLTDTSYPARYARAIAAFKGGETTKALTQVDALIADRPDNPYLWELKGQILFENERSAEAEAPQRKAVELMPDAALLRLNLGHTLIASSDPAKLEEGIVQLNKALQLEAEMPMAWSLLARAYDRKSEPGMARLATAEQYFGLGHNLYARDFAMRAREILPKDTPSWRRATDIVQVVDAEQRDLPRERTRPESAPPNLH